MRQLLRIGHRFEGRAPEAFRTAVADALHPSNAKAESSQHFASAKTCDLKGSTVEIRCHPFPFQCELQEGRSQRPAEMGPPLAPIEACAREPAAQHPSRLEIDVKSLKGLGSIRCDVVCLVAARQAGRKPPQCLEAIVQRHAHSPRQVIVASPCGT
jgi:hypothetical protein